MLRFLAILVAIPLVIAAGSGLVFLMVVVPMHYLGFEAGITVTAFIGLVMLTWLIWDSTR